MHTKPMRAVIGEMNSSGNNTTYVQKFADKTFAEGGYSAKFAKVHPQKFLAIRYTKKGWVSWNEFCHTPGM